MFIINFLLKTQLLEKLVSREHLKKTDVILCLSFVCILKEIEITKEDFKVD